MPQSTIPTFRQKPGVVLQTQRPFLAGINQIVNAMRPTLGPIPRTVAVDRGFNGRSPELLDNGGLIARRIIDLPHRSENVGAMYLRGMLWQHYQQVGDGTVTAALLFQKLFTKGIKHIVAGGNSMPLRHYLEQGLATILERLMQMTRPIVNAAELTQIAQTVCHEPEIAYALGKIFTLIGEDGFLDIRAGRRREVEHKFIEGSYWPGGLASKLLLDNGTNGRIELEETAVLLTDLDIENAEELMPVFRAAVAANIRTLLLVAHKFSESVIGLLVQSVRSSKLRVYGVKIPGLRSDEQIAALEDLAILTGGQRILQAAGDTFAGVTAESFGTTRRLWADMENVGLINGKGDPRHIRTHVAALRRAFLLADNADVRQRLQKRIGRLLGGSATLDVGGITESEMAARKALAKRTATAVRGALRQGVLPGGGVSLLACRTALQAFAKRSKNRDEQAAYRIMAAAMSAPFCAIVENGGYCAAPLLARFNGDFPDQLFDVHQGQIVATESAGIWDSAAVLQTAVTNAVRSAALALTVDTIVHRRKPPVMAVPDSAGL